MSKVKAILVYISLLECAGNTAFCYMFLAIAPVSSTISHQLFYRDFFLQVLSWLVKTFTLSWKLLIPSYLLPTPSLSAMCSKCRHSSVPSDWFWLAQTPVPNSGETPPSPVFHSPLQSGCMGLLRKVKVN